MALLLRLQVFGNLNNGGNAGLWCLNGNDWLDRTRWNNASRLYKEDHFLPHNESDKEIQVLDERQVGEIGDLILWMDTAYVIIPNETKAPYIVYHARS